MMMLVVTYNNMVSTRVCVTAAVPCMFLKHVSTTKNHEKYITLMP